MAGTGRVITSAGLIMTVFLSFVANPSPLVRMMGLGLATAVVLDATIVRMVLVPATMTLLGRANWWLPRWLDRLLPRVGKEGLPAAVATVPDGRLERLEQGFPARMDLPEDARDLAAR
jgi:RND superfamily putative drug exporter